MRGQRPECCELDGGGLAGSWVQEGSVENMQALSYNSVVLFRGKLAAL